MIERLTIDEVIEHCNKTCDMTEKIAKARGHELESIESNQFWEHYQVRAWLKELKQYKDLEEQGLLLRLPCKVGDKLYRLDSVGFIISDTVHSIHILQGTAYFEMNYWNKDICLSEVGKTTFTTQAEAEHYRKLARLYLLRKQKLKDKENNKDNE